MYDLIKDEGRLEERISSRPAMLWTVLDERLHPHAEPLKAQIMAMTDAELSAELIKLALCVNSLAEFSQHLC